MFIQDLDFGNKSCLSDSCLFKWSVIYISKEEKFLWEHIYVFPQKLHIQTRKAGSLHDDSQFQDCSHQCINDGSKHVCLVLSLVCLKCVCPIVPYQRRNFQSDLLPRKCKNIVTVLLMLISHTKTGDSSIEDVNSIAVESWCSVNLGCGLGKNIIAWYSVVWRGGNAINYHRDSSLCNGCCTSLSTCKTHCGQGTSSTRITIQWPVGTAPEKKNYFLFVNSHQPPSPYLSARFRLLMLPCRCWV